MEWIAQMMKDTETDAMQHGRRAVAEKFYVN